MFVQLIDKGGLYAYVLPLIVESSSSKEKYVLVKTGRVTDATLASRLVSEARDYALLSGKNENSKPRIGN